MRRVYEIMSAFSLDCYVENISLSEDKEIIINYIDNNIENIIEKISDYIEEKISKNNELLLLLKENYNNHLLDYLVHFGLVSGIDNDLDNQIKDFISFSYELSKDCINNIIETILYIKREC